MIKDHADKKSVFPLTVCQDSGLLVENTWELIYRANILKKGY